MANYAPTTWATGDTITATKLNNVENGLNNLTVAGTANQVLVNGATTAVNNAAITLTLPQSIATGSSPTFAGLTLQSDAALVPIFATHAAGDNTQVTLRRSRGTQASPTDVADGDVLGMVIGQAYSGGYLNTGRMQIEIDGTFTSGQRPPSRIAWYTNTANAAAAERMRLTAAGNLGLGVTPEAWDSTFRAMQVGGTGFWMSTAAAAASASAAFGQNAYYDGAWKYAVTDEASMYSQINGTHVWYTAASGAADSAITWTTAMVVDNNGHVGVGATPDGATRMFQVQGSINSSGNSYGSVFSTGLTAASGAAGSYAGVGIQSAFTSASGATVTRFSQVAIYGVTASLTGTLTNHNTLYLDTPVGGTTVRVIDSAAGGYLTTGGIWTDNPSWRAIKTDIRYMEGAEQASLFNWFRDEYKPARYRYPSDQAYEYDHLGFLLDDMPQNVREIVMADAKGGISSKDNIGLLFALVQEAARRIGVLEARLAA